MSVRRLVLGTILLATLVAAIGSGSWLIPRLGTPASFWFAPIETVFVAGKPLRLVRVEYGQGLRDVPTLGNLDGAIFVFDHALSAENGMGMDAVLMPLDVAFFDPDGHLIDQFTMPLCTDDPCDGAVPSREWQFAIEAPAGSLGWLPDGAHLER